MNSINESFAAEQADDGSWCVKDEAGECVASGLDEVEAKAKADELNQGNE